MRQDDRANRRWCLLRDMVKREFLPGAQIKSIHDKRLWLITITLEREGFPIVQIKANDFVITESGIDHEGLFKQAIEKTRLAFDTIHKAGLLGGVLISKAGVKLCPDKDLRAQPW